MSHQEKLTFIPDWAKAISDEAYFAQEQACLGEVWHFLGFESDIPKVNDWFRTRLGGRSIFVQRFKEGLRAFENICPHRFNQIRCEDKGNSPVVCGFHHWRFDSHGDAVGIPKCKEYYGKTPKEIDARLHAVELAVCGGFIFGRLGGGPTLQEWLGDGFDILNHICADLTFGGQFSSEINAHWKIVVGAFLDDYHIVAVHPSTFGANGYLRNERLNYVRFGAHNVFFFGTQHKDLSLIRQACQTNTFESQSYAFFQFFPMFFVGIKKVARVFGDDYAYLIVENFIPQWRNKTHLQVRFFIMPFSRPSGFFRRCTRKVVTSIINIIYRYTVTKITKEDIQVCENIQQVSHQIQGEIRPSALEERLGWFEDVYAKYVTNRIKQKND
jgi:phenylpropionate dioxygenase-like ring-hydroxylating dioxygenase large terminal subunit